MSESGPSPDDGEGSEQQTTMPGQLGRDAPDPIIDLRTSIAAIPTSSSPIPVPPDTPHTPTPADAPAAAAIASPAVPVPTPPTAPTATGGPGRGRPPGPAASGPETPGQHGQGVTRTVVVSFVPLLLVVLITAGLALGVSLGASAKADQAERISRVVAAEQSGRFASDELWAGVLGLVSGGVGQQVNDPDEVLTLVGVARSSAPGAVPQGADAGPERVAALESHREFVDSVEEALAAAAGDPIDLGNQLDDLAGLHGQTQQDSVAWTGALESSAADSRSTSEDLRTAAIAIAIIGLLLSILVLVATWRRLVTVLDRPAAIIGDTMHRFAGGDTGARIRPRNRAGLAALGFSVDNDLEAVSGQFVRLRSRAEWGERSRMIFEALDQAEDEPAAHDVIQRALAMVDPRHHPVELLLADRGSTRLQAVAADPETPPPACPVDSTGACVALRRGQVAVFDSSESINACPKLRDRPGGPLSAVCVPVTVATRPVGVLHMTGPEFAPPEAQVTDRLVTLSVQVGNRLSALRTLESTRKEASTDGLTGLPNRRMLESEVATLLERGTPFVMVLADLDKFKKLNDNFGHEVGDKALQLFSAVLRDNVRGNDVVSRLGGEEFVLVYPNMSVEISIEAIGRLRQALARAVAAARLPPFTCSFGVSHSDVGADGDTILRVADAGLLRAKELGGDQAVFADEDLAAAVFNNGAGHGPTGTTRGERAQAGAADAGVEDAASPEHPDEPDR